MGVLVCFVFSKVTLAAERSVVGENWLEGSRGDQPEGTVVWTRDTERSWQLGKAQDVLWRWEPLALLKDRLQSLLCGTLEAFLEALGPSPPPHALPWSDRCKQEGGKVVGRRLGPRPKWSELGARQSGDTFPGLLASLPLQALTQPGRARTHGKGGQGTPSGGW